MSKTTCPRTASARHPPSPSLCVDSPTGRSSTNILSLTSAAASASISSLLFSWGATQDAYVASGLSSQYLLCVWGVGGCESGFWRDRRNRIRRFLRAGDAEMWSPPHAVPAPHTRSSTHSA